LARPARNCARRARSCSPRHEYIVHLAHHDGLTDLPNRTALADRLEETCGGAKQAGTSFAVLTVDLDHFKEANDLFGHVIGDELLCAISRRLQGAAKDAFIARVGGDEFSRLGHRRPARGWAGVGQAPARRGG
jgi:diguanylate cyclase (GGDEF)-like protein